MLRKLSIAGLVLALAGAASLGWLTWQQAQQQKLRQQCRAKYPATAVENLQNWMSSPDNLQPALLGRADAQAGKTAAQIRLEQHERFLADLDKLAQIDPHLYPVACALYGDDWQEKLAQYTSRQELEKNLFAAAIMCTCFGGAMVVTALCSTAIGQIGRRNRARQHQPAPRETKTETAQPQSAAEQKEDAKNQSLAMVLNCHPYSTPETADEPTESIWARKDTPHSGSCGAGPHDTPGQYKPQQQKPATQTATKLGALLGTRKALPGADGSFFSSYRALKQTQGDIKRGVKRFSKDAKLAKQITRREPDMLDETLAHLTEEVAAIRNYACQQEERVKKLQDGYDWNIIRNFALRIIRCLDNLERRIDMLAQQGLATEHLQEIRDELTFALESSGLERYEPQLNSDYRGQEKSAEAVKAKEHCDQPDLRGKIAEVVRCGYRYVVDCDNFKIVRAAQVKLFS
jgi:molecular chaperone GrpE (heat shock protein)